MVSPRAQAIGAVALSGVLCAVGAGLGSAGPAATCVALVPWIWALDRAETRRAALGLTALMAAVFMAVVFHWFPGAVARYSGGSPLLIWPLFVLASPLLAPQLVVFAAARRIVLRRGGRAVHARAALAAGGVYVATDVFWPKLFFDTLGIGLYPSPLLRQGADIAGVYGLTVLALAVNELVAAALRRALGEAGPGIGGGALRRALLPAGAALALLGAAWLHGSARLAAQNGREPERLALFGAVQSNLTAYEKLRAEHGAEEALSQIVIKHIGMSRALLDEGPVDALVWPETVYPTTFGAPKGDGAAMFEGTLRGFARGTGVPLIFGGYEADGGREHNAMFFLVPQGSGLSVESYRKRMLFPLTEWVPEAIDAPWLRRALPWTGRWSRGPGPRTVELPLRGRPAVSVLPLICYDAVVPEYVGAGAALGADMILTLSNDAWFPSAGAAELHLASAALRSVETRLPQLRVTVSGISAVIAPTGEILVRSGWDAPAKMRVEVPLFARAAPPARRLAPLLGPGAGLLSIVLLLDALRRGRVAARRARTAAEREPHDGAGPPSEPPLSPAASKPRTPARRQKKR